MSVTIPEIIDILASAREAYILGRSSLHNGRLVRAPEPGLTPRRHGGRKKVLAKLRKTEPGYIIDQAETLLIAAFDLGVKHQQREEERDE